MATAFRLLFFPLPPSLFFPPSHCCDGLCLLDQHTHLAVGTHKPRNWVALEKDIIWMADWSVCWGVESVKAEWSKNQLDVASFFLQSNRMGDSETASRDPGSASWFGVWRSRHDVKDHGEVLNTQVPLYMFWHRWLEWQTSSAIPSVQVWHGKLGSGMIAMWRSSPHVDYSCESTFQY